MKTRDSSSPYSFTQFNEEMNDFYKYLKENKYSEEDIRKIFGPITPDVKKINCLLVTMLVLFSVAIGTYCLTYIEPLAWHFSAWARISLIKLLPLWDWTLLKNEKCLITKPQSAAITPRDFNCDLCENIKQIDVYEALPEDRLKVRYLDVDVPVLVKNLQNWPDSLTVIGEVLLNADIASSRPCFLATNVFNGIPTVEELFTRTSLFDSFFLHFQNCDFYTMKQFRSVAPKPPFLPRELSPVQYSWLLWSKNYNVSQYKPLELVDKIALFGQIVGSNFVKLIPRGNCELDCPQVDVRLDQGESMVFTSLWNVEYRPGGRENVAAILEMH